MHKSRENFLHLLEIKLEKWHPKSVYGSILAKFLSIRPYFPHKKKWHLQKASSGQTISSLQDHDRRLAVSCSCELATIMIRNLPRTDHEFTARLLRVTCLTLSSLSFPWVSLCLSSCFPQLILFPLLSILQGKQTLNPNHVQLILDGSNRSCGPKSIQYYFMRKMENISFLWKPCNLSTSNKPFRP